MSGVGISFGIERVYDVMVELGLFPATIHQSAQVLFVHFDEASEAYAFNVLQAIRASQISAEIYTGKKKLDKQLQYANDKKIPTVVVVGADEMQSGMLTVKDMSTGQQNKLTLEQLIASMQGSH
jgi:histidyl-tRNA synthetase